MMITSWVQISKELGRCFNKKRQTWLG
jgi:hypothetical protein